MSSLSSSSPLLGTQTIIDSAATTTPTPATTSTMLLVFFPTALLLLLLVLLFAWVLYLYVRWATSPLHQLPGPKRNKANPWDFLVGQFLTVLRDESFWDSPMRWWEDALRMANNNNNNNRSSNSNGHTSTSSSSSSSSVPFLAASSLFGSWVVLVLDVDVLHQILTKPEVQHPVRFPKNLLILKQVIGHALSSLEGPDWYRHRRILQPSFQARYITKVLLDSVPRRTQQLAQAWKQASSNNRRIDVASHISALTLDIIGDVSFMHDFQALKLVEAWANSPDDDDKLGPLSDPLMQALAIAMKPKFIDILLGLLHLAWLDRYISPQTVRIRHQLYTAVGDIIHQVRTNHPHSKHSDAKCLLQLLLDAKDESSNNNSNGSNNNSNKFLNDLELRDEASQFVVAGHETTATWCYWTLYLLAKHPDAQEKVYQELSALSSSSSSSARKNNENENNDEAGAFMVDLETIETALPYFNACLQESLRLYPPASTMVRMTTKTEHFKGYTIPAGTRLVLPIYMLHRHPDHWATTTTTTTTTKNYNVDAFMPERWLNDLEGKQLNRFAFMPFGAGARSCIGQRFAQIEAKLILVSLLKQFRITLAPGMPSHVNITKSTVIKATPTIYICVHERK